MIDLPADTVWPTPTLGVAIVQGDPMPPTVTHSYETVTRDNHVTVHGTATLFVAPQVWAQYDKPCETCRGNGRLWRLDKDGTAESCSDCRDGRQVWTVRWPCATCMGNPMKYLDLGYCPKCGPPCGIRSARATIQVVPVTDVWPKGADHTQPVTCVTRNGVLYIEGLDPPPTPGRDFAVIVRPTDD